jgi:hypothetical protein
MSGAADVQGGTSAAGGQEKVRPGTAVKKLAWAMSGAADVQEVQVPQSLQ